MAMSWTNDRAIRATVSDNCPAYVSDAVALFHPNVDSAVSNIDSSFVANAAMIAMNSYAVTSNHDSFDLKFNKNKLN